MASFDVIIFGERVSLSFDLNKNFVFCTPKKDLWKSAYALVAANDC